MKMIIESPQSETDRTWRVQVDDRWEDGLTWDEMLGCIAAMTLPERRPCEWLKTQAEHDAWKARLEDMRARNNEPEAIIVDDNLLADQSGQ